VLQGKNRFVGDTISIKLDICMVQSPDDELVNDGECKGGGVDRLLFEVVIPRGVHNIESHKNSGAHGAGIGAS
jgi:hypothetical protein